MTHKDDGANKGKRRAPASKKSSPPKDGNSKDTVTVEKPPSAADLADITVEGEGDDSVPIFDTCDDVRKKIRDHLGKPGVKQTTFARDLSELVRSEQVQARHISKFLTFKGPRGSGHNPAFYAGYMYFEKLRTKQGEKKSAKRERLEDAWKADGGFPREGTHNKRLLMVKGETWSYDQLGQIQISGHPRGGGINMKPARK
ncbi:uncharacterized protein LTR77_001642 [Saxophila tyrrhenica]|uniref:DUF7726 domain-containing protein n=1 Tax=Saxophila tyrrhenica TaxID=1690608 RepID=A0AAV9PNS1_9PEZI|nr:hypothetical protein LTR77_001642 [Saxophila tyrrhenica]